MMPATTSRHSSWIWTWRRVWKKSTPTWPVPQTQRTSRLCSTLWQTSSSKKTLKIAVFSKQFQSEKRCAVTTLYHTQGLCWYRLIGSRWARPLPIQFNPHLANHIWTILCCQATTSGYNTSKQKPKPHKIRPFGMKRIMGSIKQFLYCDKKKHAEQFGNILIKMCIYKNSRKNKITSTRLTYFYSPVCRTSFPTLTPHVLALT